jgi:hypothetical protein
MARRLAAEPSRLAEATGSVMPSEAARIVQAAR